MPSNTRLQPLTTRIKLATINYWPSPASSSVSSLGVEFIVASSAPDTGNYLLQAWSRTTLRQPYDASSPAFGPADDLVDET